MRGGTLAFVLASAGFSVASASKSLARSKMLNVPLQEKGEVLRTTLPRSAPDWHSQHAKKGRPGKGRHVDQWAQDRQCLSSLQHHRHGGREDGYRQNRRAPARDRKGAKQQQNTHRRNEN